MTSSLYDISVANYLQTLRAVDGFLVKALAHCGVADMDLHDLVETSLHHDMQPLRYQLLSVAHHSLGAIKALESGQFSPPNNQTDISFVDLQSSIIDTIEALEQYTPEQINALSGNDVMFALGDMKMPFDAEGFILSFSLPNFYFHATTAYDILRTQDVPLGKRDFMGMPRLKA